MVANNTQKQKLDRITSYHTKKSRLRRRKFAKHNKGA